MRSTSPKWNALRACRHGAASFAFVAALGSRVAYAQDADNAAAARVLFSEGRKLAAEGKYVDACPKFEESLRLDRGIGTEFNLADCWEHVNRTASAWGLFLNVAAEAKANGQGVREDLARSRAAALEANLSRLTIEVPVPASGLEIRRDGVVVGKASWGVPVPVDTGPHTVEARAPGRKDWTSKVELSKPGPVTVQVPSLDIKPPPTNTSPAEPAPGGLAPSLVASPPGTLAREQPARGGGQRTAALTIGAVGVAGIAVGTVFALVTKSKNDSAKKLCPSGENCTQDDANRHTALIDDAKSARTVAFVGLGAGGAALVTGAVLYLTAPRGTSGSANTRWRAKPLVGIDCLGGALEGVW